MVYSATLLQLLDRFNRKERFFLVAYALGNPRFQVSDEFRAALGKIVGASIPMDALCFMDYHLDWLYAALILARASPEEEVFDSPNFMGATNDDPPFNVNTNQEDIDLLVAFDEGEDTHLILVEAKGVTGWGNAQIQSKGRRLRTIFGDEGNGYPGVIPEFVIASPRRPKRLKEAGLPSFMRKGDPFLWMALRVPPHRIEIERYDKSLSKALKAGQHWRVKPI